MYCTTLKKVMVFLKIEEQNGKLSCFAILGQIVKKWKKRKGSLL